MREVGVQRERGDGAPRFPREDARRVRAAALTEGRVGSARGSRRGEEREQEARDDERVADRARASSGAGSSGCGALSFSRCQSANARSAPSASPAATSSTKPVGPPRTLVRRPSALSTSTHSSSCARRRDTRSATNSSDSSMAAPAWHKRDPLRSASLRTADPRRAGAGGARRNTHRRREVGRSSSTPPCSRTMSNAIESPSPVPRSGPLVVKNGSKMRWRSASGTPGPSSRTLISTTSPTRRVTTSMRPADCSASACLAFTSRFRNTCSRREAEPWTNGRSGSSRRLDEHVAVAVQVGESDRILDDAVHVDGRELVARHPREALHRIDDAADAADALDALPDELRHLRHFLRLAGFQRGEVLRHQRGHVFELGRGSPARRRAGC